DPVSVTVADDGTVIASNFVRANLAENGSLSTWIQGPGGGTFVGNFPMTDSFAGGFVTILKDGTVFFDDYVGSTSLGALWSLKCPAGACGAQTQVADSSIYSPGGMAVNSTGDLLLSQGSEIAKTYEMPDPNPSTFPLTGYP